jgi:hypothetical protein
VKTYADTSFLFSLYATDANSARADAWRRANPAPLPFTVNHTPSTGCRTLDVLHVAVAKLMGVTEFCSFDTR